MKQVIIFPKGTLSPQDRARLGRAGCIAIEADDPSKVVCSVPVIPDSNGNAILEAAMHAISKCGYDEPRQLFARFLASAEAARLTAVRNRPAPAPKDA